MNRELQKELIIRIDKIWFVLVLVLLGINLSVPVYSQSNTINKYTSQNRMELASLISEWEGTSDLLKRANIAKKMQAILGVKRDGLIGNQTFAAIMSSGISTKITKPTKSEISITRMMIEVSEGKLPEERLSEISSRAEQFKDIKEQIKFGRLTKSQGERKMSEIVNSITSTDGAGISQNSRRETSSPNIFSTSKSTKCLGCVDGHNADGSKIITQDVSLKQKNTENRNVFSVKKGNEKLDRLQNEAIDKDLKFEASDFDKKGLKNTRKKKKKKKKK